MGELRLWPFRSCCWRGQADTSSPPQECLLPWRGRQAGPGLFAPGWTKASDCGHQSGGRACHGQQGEGTSSSPRVGPEGGLREEGSGALTQAFLVPLGLLLAWGRVDGLSGRAPVSLGCPWGFHWHPGGFSEFALGLFFCPVASAGGLQLGLTLTGGTLQGLALPPDQWLEPSCWFSRKAPDQEPSWAV